MSRLAARNLLVAALPLLVLPAESAAQSETAMVAGQHEDATTPKATQICLAPVAVEAAPAGMDPATVVRDAFTSYLSGPSLAVQPLSARLRSQVREEAKLAGCRFLMLLSVKHERKTGGGGLFGKVAGAAVQQGAWSVASTAGSSVGRAVAGAAAGAANTAASDYANGSRSKDELTLSYQLESETGALLAEKSEKRKAKMDGEDLLTPLVQRASEAVAEATRHANPEKVTNPAEGRTEER